MDHKKFTNPSGTLQPILLGKLKDWSFIPDKMPPNWEFPVRLWPLLSEATTALGRLDGIGATLEDAELLLTPLRNREALTSSALEGTYVSPEELLRFGLAPDERDAGKLSEQQEVSNYNQALQKGLALLETMPFCVRVIKEMHNTLLASIPHRTHIAGKFRPWQVLIGSTGRFIPPPADLVENLMHDLEAYINDPQDDFDPLVRCYLVHAQFETIHPFEDGNGRIGRVLLALMIQKWLDHKNPWLYMSAYFEEYKDEYISNLFQVSATSNWEDWIEFCLNGTLAQANDSIRRCDLFVELRKRFHNLAGDIATPRTHSIIDSLFTKTAFTVGTIQHQYGVSYPTARDDIRRLEQLGIVREMGEYRPKIFFSAPIIHTAYSQPSQLNDESNF